MGCARASRCGKNLGFRGGMNLSRYVHNSPVNRTDPFGTQDDNPDGEAVLIEDQPAPAAVAGIFVFNQTIDTLIDAQSAAAAVASEANTIISGEAIPL